MSSVSFLSDLHLDSVDMADAVRSLGCLREAAETRRRHHAQVVLRLNFMRGKAIGELALFLSYSSLSGLIFWRHPVQIVSLIGTSPAILDVSDR